MSSAGAQLKSSRFSWRTLSQASYSDVLLTFGVVAIIALMIWPLPLWLIDALVAVNISIGICLLLVAIYIPSPVAFPSFPSVLLLSTLFRLSLSIAITRQILLQADGGQLIETFGTVVAGGNIVVGLVVFLIITVVQFIVVAKGAERVAEVAARFTLDAMPGKQLSIDSDLRSGLMDKDGAREKRRHLEVESQLHGSLDGAMKFVKGDAIAGIIIIIINLLGGLAIGILQNGLSLADATRTYSILTIGDGLVAQIPALLSAISAGLIVTRTANDERDNHLGDAISRQIADQPRVLLVTGIVALGMMFVPGFPKVVFLLLGVSLLGISAWRMRENVGFLRIAFKVPQPSQDDIPESVEPSAISLPAPLEVQVHESVANGEDLDVLRSTLHRTALELRHEYGVPVPAPTVRQHGGLLEREYRVLAHGLRIASGMVAEERVFVPGINADAQDANGQAANHGAESTPALAYQPPLSGYWTDEKVDGGLDTQGFLCHHFKRAVQRQLSDFVGIQEASNIYQRLGRDYPDLVKETLRAVAPQRITEVLKRLVAEDIPIRDLRGVFEALAEAGTREKDIQRLTEQVRVAMRRQVSDRFADDNRTLAAILVQPELEDRLRQGLRGADGAGTLAVEPELAHQVLSSIRQHLGAIEGQNNPVLLCSMDVRKPLRSLTENEFFELPVLSFQELIPDLRVVRAGQIAV